MDSQISLSNSATNKIRELVLEEQNPDLKLRVYIIGGGCSGFQYGFAFEEETEEGDFIIDNDGRFRF